MSDYGEYKVTVRDKDRRKSQVVVHAHSDHEARKDAERVTGKDAVTVKRES